ncbi:ATP-binding cassette domain-containing protein [Geosporobacter ferrireducens]|uniref:ATP-binding cassette domain-containing protein n=1 Tax=Geosporobacter ferrireducens TaxID=1424294 RepID=UPI00139B7A59|nr:ATP-binding cassette domain-containing protein [Geosporobacter ferrireducens]MTI56592.1 ATP-binding cassette domain-containing protein [Geosporobacter ferrireducens]
MKYAVEVQDLKKSFSQQGKGKIKIIEAVCGVTFSVKQGEIFGFLGPNGAGKTTCQRMLTTLLPIDSGSAVIAGFDVEKNAHEVRKHIGYVSQLGGADLSATGRENLILTGRLYGFKREDVEEKVNKLANLLDLTELLDRFVRTYSGGQKRRLEIALGIIHDPDILFMDEPTTGLDPQNRANLWVQIRKLRENGMTIFLTTHYLEEADELADRLVIMDHGKIVAEGTPLALKRQISGDVIQMKLKGDGAAAHGIFEKLDFVNESRMDDQTVCLYVNDGAKALPLIFDLMKEQNIELDTISLSEPTLDDVFLKQTGRSLRDTGKEESQ